MLVPSRGHTAVAQPMTNSCGSGRAKFRLAERQKRVGMDGKEHAISAKKSTPIAGTR